MEAPSLKAALSPHSPLISEKEPKKLDQFKTTEEKNSRMGKTGVIIGVVVAVVVVVAIVVPCVLLIPSSSSNAADDLPNFPFEDIWSSKYSYKSIYPSWDKSTTDQKDYITMENDAVVRRNIAKPDTNVAVLAPKSVKEGFSATSYVISADAKFIAYRSNVQQVWRHSYTANYNIYDVESDKEVTLTLPQTIQHLEWAPIGHRLAFVQDFTLYMVDDIGATVIPTIVQVSPNGTQNMDYYGIPDWMYEEEMISANNVLYWSPSATRLAYLHTNEAGVQQIEYTWYGDKQYPQTIKIAYPKAGTTIGTAELWVYDVASNKTMPLTAPDDWITEDHYFSRFTWGNDTSCLATWTNRMQTKSIGRLCIMDEETNLFNCGDKPATTETIVGGWVGSFGPFYPIWRSDADTHDYFTIYTRNRAGSDVGGYWQLAYVSETLDNFRWMTNTDYDIVGLNFYDSSSGFIYFTAAYNEARRRHILRVKHDAADVVVPECLTCNLLTSYPDRCGWVNPVFTDDGRTVVINCRGDMVPMTLLIDITSEGVWGQPTVLENNDNLLQAITEVKWPKREFKEFKSAKYSKAYNYEIWYPADFDSTKKYPLLVEVYAGPEFQKVTDTWRKGFAQTYMVSTRDIIVVSVDGRGSAFEGTTFMRQTYKKLGQYEPVDQTDFAKYLRDTYEYIDGENIAIWGWSYGGYITSHTLGYDNGNTFKCGIAVAPLGDWTWYDAMYAERYMGDLQDNADGYEKASIIRGHNLANFKNSQYTLIHGTADDNVHFQSAAEMEKALVTADVDFDDFFYADEAHSINTGPNANKHIYHQLDIRLSHCLGRVDTPYGGPN